MSQQQIARNIKLSSFDFNNDGSITESFVLTHSLDLASPESLIECFKRFLYILGILPETMVDILDGIEEKEYQTDIVSSPILSTSPQKNVNIDIKKEVSNDDNVKKFLKQINESPEFMKRIFELFLRDINDGKI